MWPGNTADVKTLMPVVKRMRQRFHFQAGLLGVAHRVGGLRDDFQLHAPLVQPVPGVDDVENGADHGGVFRLFSLFQGNGSVATLESTGRWVR